MKPVCNFDRLLILNRATLAWVQSRTLGTRKQVHMLSLMRAAHIRAMAFKDDGKARIRSLIGDKQGVTALEYALVASVITGVVVLGFTSLGVALSTKFVTIGTSL